MIKQWHIGLEIAVDFWDFFHHSIAWCSLLFTFVNTERQTVECYRILSIYYKPNIVCLFVFWDKISNLKLNVTKQTENCSLKVF